MGKRLIITNGTIIDGTGSDPIRQGTVVVEGNKITEVSATAQTGDSETKVIDASGKTVLPGMINMHDHAFRKRLRWVPEGISYGTASKNLVAEPQSYLNLLSASNLFLELKEGITTTRDAGAGYDITVNLRRIINEGFLPGPRLIVSGQPIVMTGGHEYRWGRQADGPDEVRKAAREQLLTGVDVLKFMATGGLARFPEEHPDVVELNEDELRAGIQEAHKHHKKTFAHAYATDGIKNAVRAGIDSVEHGVFLDEEAIALMLERGTDLVPTMTGLRPTANAYLKAGRKDLFDEITKVALIPQMESFAMAVEAGIRYGVGTDSAGEMVEEMLLMQEAGKISTMDCILGTTGNAAKILGMEDQFGTLTPGLAADVIVVDGNPLDDVRALRSVIHVVKGGQHLVREGELII